MAKNEFEKNWKIGTVQDEPYTHLKERIRITVGADNSVSFDVRPESPHLASWGNPVKAGTYYKGNPGEIRGTFPFNGTPHVYVMTLTHSNSGKWVLNCEVDDADQPSKELQPLQAGSWVAEDEGAESV